MVPISLVQEVIQLNHDLPKAGHAEVAKTITRVKEKCWWKNMGSDITQYVPACKSCAQLSNYGKVKAPLGKIFNESETPFQVVVYCSTSKQHLACY